MAVSNRLSLQPQPVDGVRLASVAAGIKTPGRKDLVVMRFRPGTRFAAVFTRNRFRAAPVLVARRHLATPQNERLVLVNTGYANAGTGPAGERDALECCSALAEAAGVPAESVLPFSTGVIGEPLPVERIRSGIDLAVDAVAADGWLDAAEGIMTTDTRPKAESVRFESNGRAFTITGIAKGAGMIRPNMATMLAFVATDAVLPDGGEDLFRSVISRTFNRISVDGDTSTNDACLLAATGAAGATPLLADFERALEGLCAQLAQGLVRDAEGATRFVAVTVRGAGSEPACESVAFTVAESPLVKTALYAGDPNWGRILAAVGRAPGAEFNVDDVRVWLGDQCIVEHGGVAAGYDEAIAGDYMAGEDIDIVIDLGRGDDASATVWTCDFSYDYVRINAEYRS
ncbi:bifunctional glutamate N-acetyltransferase/amino-acid acetyltransferase ArgJ [Ectothiorhodospiraceae bacterium WFHF3C12]|nr:bifunctional glutamate N-acetyltransferase/amino-acid acetyltransferase ArgJ [Ectothiorhodospiraceae bacterium WFHF3C12]